MIFFDFNEVFAKVCNINLSDQAANELIEEAVLQAGIQIRNHARQLRLNELDLMAHQKKCRGINELEAKANRLRLEMEKEESIKRQIIQAKHDNIDFVHQGIKY